MKYAPVLGTRILVRINGPQLKRQRERRFLSREELAEMLGSHEKHVGRLEDDGPRRVHMYMLARMATALDTHPSTLIYRHPREQKPTQP